MRVLRYVGVVVVLIVAVAAASASVLSPVITFQPMGYAQSVQLFKVLEACSDLHVENSWNQEAVLYRCSSLHTMIMTNTHGEPFIAYISTNDPEEAVLRNHPGFFNLNWITDDGMQLVTWEVWGDQVRYWFAVKGYGIVEHPQSEETFMIRGLHVDPWGGHLCMFAGDDAPSDAEIQALLERFAGSSSDLDFDEIRRDYPRHCLS